MFFTVVQTCRISETNKRKEIMQIEHVSFIVCVVSFPAFCDIIGRDTNANTNTCQHKTSSAHVCAQVHIMQIIVTTLFPLSFLVQAPCFDFKPATRTFWASVVNIMPWTLQDNGVGNFGGLGVSSRLEVSSSDEEMADGDGGRGPTDR